MSEQLIRAIRDRYDSWRAFHCVPENAKVFERQNEQMHRDIGTLLRAIDRYQSPSVGKFLVDRKDELDSIKLECQMSDAEAALWLVGRESLDAIENLRGRVAALETKDDPARSMEQ